CNASHEPIGAALASGELDGNTFSTDVWGDWETFRFVDIVELELGKIYAVLIKSPLSNNTNYAEWILNTNAGYLGGRSGYSDDNGATWQFNPVLYDNHFIIHSHMMPRARQFSIRTGNDVSDTPTVGAANYTAIFHCSQKGEAFAPYLTIKYRLPA
ncbi:unnamed protein product, partial [marine sediment metagenome]